jgi:hypothetical protein
MTPSNHVPIPQPLSLTNFPFGPPSLPPPPPVVAPPAPSPPPPPQLNRSLSDIAPREDTPLELPGANDPRWSSNPSIITTTPTTTIISPLPPPPLSQPMPIPNGSPRIIGVPSSFLPSLASRDGESTIGMPPPPPSSSSSSSSSSVGFHSFPSPPGGFPPSRGIGAPPSNISSSSGRRSGMDRLSYDIVLTGSAEDRARIFCELLQPVNNQTYHITLWLILSWRHHLLSRCCCRVYWRVIFID